MEQLDYCRYEETLDDLNDCYRQLHREPKSETEKAFKRRLIEMCVKISKEFGGK